MAGAGQEPREVQTRPPLWAIGLTSPQRPGDPTLDRPRGSTPSTCRQHPQVRGAVPDAANYADAADTPRSTATPSWVAPAQPWDTTGSVTRPAAVIPNLQGLGGRDPKIVWPGPRLGFRHRVRMGHVGPCDSPASWSAALGEPQVRSPGKVAPRAEIQPVHLGGGGGGSRGSWPHGILSPHRKAGLCQGPRPPHRHDGPWPIRDAGIADIRVE